MHEEKIYKDVFLLTGVRLLFLGILLTRKWVQVLVCHGFFLIVFMIVWFQRSKFFICLFDKFVCWLVSLGARYDPRYQLRVGLD